MYIVSVIIKSNCLILQFIHQMFNVSALLLDDALLKCVVIEINGVAQLLGRRSLAGGLNLIYA